MSKCRLPKKIWTRYVYNASLWEKLAEEAKIPGPMNLLGWRPLWQVDERMLLTKEELDPVCLTMHSYGKNLPKKQKIPGRIYDFSSKVPSGPFFEPGVAVRWRGKGVKK